MKEAESAAMEVGYRCGNGYLPHIPQEEVHLGKPLGVGVDHETLGPLLLEGEVSRCLEQPAISLHHREVNREIAMGRPSGVVTSTARPPSSMLPNPVIRMVPGFDDYIALCQRDERYKKKRKKIGFNSTPLC